MKGGMLSEMLRMVGEMVSERVAGEGRTGRGVKMEGCQLGRRYLERRQLVGDRWREVSWRCVIWRSGSWIVANCTRFWAAREETEGRGAAVVRARFTRGVRWRGGSSIDGRCRVVHWKGVSWKGGK